MQVPGGSRVPLGDDRERRLHPGGQDATAEAVRAGEEAAQVPVLQGHHLDALSDDDEHDGAGGALPLSEELGRVSGAGAELQDARRDRRI